MKELSQTAGGSLPRMSVAPVPAQAETLSVVPRKITRLLLGITAVLVGIHVLTQLAILVFSDFIGRDWLNIMFGLGGEGNLPATFSGGLLLLSGVLLGAIALQKRRSGAPFATQWALLSAVFLFLALDEVASIHDHFIVPLRRLMNFEGVFHFVWVIPYGLAVLFLSLGLFRFMLHLPARTRALFVLAGFLYVGAALGLELVQGYSHAQAASAGPLAFLSVTTEELLEMLGVIVFISALLSYIERQLPGFALRLEVASDPGRKGVP